MLVTCGCIGCSGNRSQRLLSDDSALLFPPDPASVLSFVLYWCSALLSSLPTVDLRVRSLKPQLSTTQLKPSRYTEAVADVEWTWTGPAEAETLHAGVKCRMASELRTLWAGKPVWHQRHIQRPSMILEKNVFLPAFISKSFWPRIHVCVVALKDVRATSIMSAILLLNATRWASCSHAMWLALCRCVSLLACKSHVCGC